MKSVWQHYLKVPALLVCWAVVAYVFVFQHEHGQYATLWCVVITLFGGYTMNTDIQRISAYRKARRDKMGLNSQERALLMDCVSRIIISCLEVVTILWVLIFQPKHYIVDVRFPFVALFLFLNLRSGQTMLRHQRAECLKRDAQKVVALRCKETIRSMNKQPSAVLGVEAPKVLLPVDVAMAEGEPCV